MLAQEFRKALKSLNLTQAACAEALDVQPRTVRRWASGERDIPGPVIAALTCWLERYAEHQEADLDDVRDRIRIGLREDAPGTISLDADLPLINLYFQVTNLSPVDLILDRMLVDVWFGQPTFSVAVLDRLDVPAGEITQGIHVRQVLAENQARQIEAFNAAAGRAGSLHIFVTAYFESRLGRFSVKHSIERPKL